MLSFGLMVVWGLVAALGVASRLGALVIRVRAQAELEQGRHFAVASVLLVMPPDSVVVQRHEDGGTCLLARGSVPAQVSGMTLC